MSSVQTAPPATTPGPSDDTGPAPARVVLVAWKPSASMSTLIPAPRNRRYPARDRASIWRTRKPGGPDATELKNDCHHGMSLARERGESTPDPARRVVSV